MQGPPRGKPMFVAARDQQPPSAGAAAQPNAHNSETSAEVAERALLLSLGSSQMLSRGDEPLPQSFLYVDELHCVGCSECAHAAPRRRVANARAFSIRRFRQPFRQPFPSAVSVRLSRSPLMWAPPPGADESAAALD